MRRLELILLLAGTIAVSMGLAQLVRFRSFQFYAKAGAKRDIPASKVQPLAPASPVVGRLDIPRLHLSLPIMDNDDPQSLALSVGHIPGTSVIGSLGNAGIAGHRDTAFHQLKNISLGDRVDTHTARDASYIVRRIQVVDAADTRLLAESDSPLLTLVTCYPFNYVGSAPKRFVIQAQMTSH